MTFNSQTFQPAPEQIVVIPKMESERFGGVYGELIQHAEDTQMCIGEVVAVGKLPKGYDIKPGQTIAFARGVMIPVVTSVRGQNVDCKVVSLDDYRGKFENNEVKASFFADLFRKITGR